MTAQISIMHGGKIKSLIEAAADPNASVTLSGVEFQAILAHIDNLKRQVSEANFTLGAMKTMHDYARIQLRRNDKGLRRHARRRRRHVREKEELRLNLDVAYQELQRVRAQSEVLRKQVTAKRQSFWSWLLGGGR